MPAIAQRHRYSKVLRFLMHRVPGISGPFDWTQFGYLPKLPAFTASPLGLTLLLLLPSKVGQVGATATSGPGLDDFFQQRSVAGLLGFQECSS